MNFKIIIVFCLFLLSRIFFINYQPVFFDSPEYLTRFADPNFMHALTSGHSPFHSGYILLFWPIFNLSKLLNMNSLLMVNLMQIVFSGIALFCFYYFLMVVVNKKIAAITTIIFSLTPIYWITNVTIMTESTYVNLFLISLFFLGKYIKANNNLKLYLFCSLLLFGLAILTNPLVMLWVPLIFTTVFFLKNNKIKIVTLSLVTSCIAAILVNSFLISYAFHVPLTNAIDQYFFGTDIRITPNISSPIAVLRLIRNAFIPIFQNNTGIILIISTISIFKIFRKNTKVFIITILWILPTIIANQWYDPLLYGRHSIIAGLGFYLLAAIFLEKRKILYYITILYLLIASIPALFLLRLPIPYIQTSKFVERLPKGLLIDTHFARPQIEKHYLGETMYVNQPGLNKNQLKDTINKYLDTKKPVFITSLALSEPYGLYSGPYLYPLSLSYLHEFELKSLLSPYTIKKYQAINNDDNLILYKITSRSASKYPDVPNLKYNKRRLDYFDPIVQFLLLIDRANIIQSHNIING
jgi:hypothetical protein